MSPGKPQVIQVALALSSGDTTAVAAKPGQRIVVRKFWGSAGATGGDLTVKNGADAVFGPMSMTAYQTVSESEWDGDGCVFYADAGQPLVFNLSAGTFGGAILYHYA